MRLYNTKWIQNMIVLFYPIAIFVILSERQILKSWLIPIIVTLVFCLLWRNVRYLIISTVLMFVTSIPLWWIFVERTLKGAEFILAWSPIIIAEFIFVVLLPEALIVTLRNVILNRLVNWRNQNENAKERQMRTPMESGMEGDYENK